MAICQAISAVVAAAMVAAVPAHIDRRNVLAPPTPAVDWTEKYIGYNNPPEGTEFKDWTSSMGTFNSTNPLRQFLHIKTPDSVQPTPVFLYAHGIYQEASSFEREGLEYVTAAGLATISWESVTAPESDDDWRQCQDDIFLVWDWIFENAEKYNLDTSRIIVGGWSRGSVCSFTGAHTLEGVTGIYFTGALPSDALEDPEVFKEVLSVNSPPMMLAYQPECVEPIEDDCVPSPHSNDVHRPTSGVYLEQFYLELGISDRITVISGMTNYRLYPYEYFDSFQRQLFLGISPYRPPNLKFEQNYIGPECMALWQRCNRFYKDGGTQCLNCARAFVFELIGYGCTEPNVQSDCKTVAGREPGFEDLWSALQ